MLLVEGMRAQGAQGGELQSFDVDILFECWTVADRLGLHNVAAYCEWAITWMWTRDSVCTRAALELSPGALRRIARGLRARMDAGRKQLPSVLSYAQARSEHHLKHGDKKKMKDNIFKVRFSRCIATAAPVRTMTRWRIDEEGMLSTWQQTIGAIVKWLGS